MPSPERKRARRQQHPQTVPDISNLQPQQQEQAKGQGAAPEHVHLPLLSLPQEVLAKHVWPHLGPWAHAQLRLTCKELKGIADSVLADTIAVVVDAQQVAGATRRTTRSAQATPPHAAAAAPATGRNTSSNQFASGACAGGSGQLTAAGTAAGAAGGQHQENQPQGAVGDVCRLLSAAPHVRAVSLVLLPGKAHSGELGRGLGPSVARIVHQIGAASNGRLTHFSLSLTEPASLQPEMLRAIAEAFPGLTQLHVRSDLTRGHGAAWAAVLRVLPASLQTVLLDLKSSEGERLSASLAAASQLTGLRSLTLGTIRAMDTQLSVTQLTPLVSDQLTSLSLCGYGTDMDSGEVLGLVNRCGPSLRQLDVNIPPEGAPAPQPAAYVAAAPHLTSLRLSAGQWNIMGGPGDMPPIAGLAGLRRLCLHQTYLPHMVTELGAGALSQLTELELNDIQEAADLVSVVRSGVVAPGCKLVLEWFSKCALEYDAAAVEGVIEVVRHPGGVHTRLPGCQLPTPHLCPLWPLGWPEGIQEWSQVGALRLLAALRGLWVDAEVEGLLTQVLALAQAQVQRQQGRPGRRGTPGRRTAAEKQQQVQQQEEEGGGAGGPHELWESLAGVEVLALESGVFSNQEEDRSTLAMVCGMFTLGLLPSLREVYLIGSQPHDWLAAMDLGPLLLKLHDRESAAAAAAPCGGEITGSTQAAGGRVGGRREHTTSGNGLRIALMRLRRTLGANAAAEGGGQAGEVQGAQGAQSDEGTGTSRQQEDNAAGPSAAAQPHRPVVVKIAAAPEPLGLRSTLAGLRAKLQAQGVDPDQGLQLAH